MPLLTVPSSGSIVGGNITYPSEPSVNPSQTYTPPLNLPLGSPPAPLPVARLISRPAASRSSTHATSLGFPMVGSRSNTNVLLAGFTLLIVQLPLIGGTESLPVILIT